MVRFSIHTIIKNITVNSIVSFIQACKDIVRAQTFKNSKSLDFRVNNDFSTGITSLDDA